MTTELLEKMEGSFKDMQASLMDFQRSQEKRMDFMMKNAQRPPFEPSDPEQGLEYKAFLDYVAKGDEGMFHKALSTQNGPQGGFLVPNQMVEQIEERLLNLSPMRSVSRVAHIHHDSLEIVLDKGCADVGWVGEVEERDDTKAPEFHKVQIPAHIMYAKPKASQKLLDDVRVDLESWLIHKISEKMAMQENLAFTRGDGKGKPRGFLTYDIVPVGRGEVSKIESLCSGKDGDFHNADVFMDIMQTLPSHYLSKAVWMMSRSTLSVLRRLKNTSTGHYVWQPSLAERSPQTLLGYPIVINDDMPPLKAGVPSHAVVFGNFYEAYHIVDRQDISILRDPYSAKPFVEFYATKRVGGDLLQADALKIVSAFKVKEG